MIGRANPNMPPDVFDGCDMTSKKPWCFSHALSTAFWKSWMTEFRTIIQEPKKWAERTKNLRIEDLVLLTDASDTRGPSRESWRSSRQRTELRVQQSSRSDLPKSIALPPRFTRWTWNIVFDSQAGSVMILTERDSYSIILSILIFFLCSSFSFFFSSVLSALARHWDITSARFWTIAFVSRSLYHRLLQSMRVVINTKWDHVGPSETSILSIIVPHWVAY